LREAIEILEGLDLRHYMGETPSSKRRKTRAVKFLKRHGSERAYGIRSDVMQDDDDWDGAQP
jgi:hypothetical protein